MLSKARKPRCPNGTRRNKKTNNCDKKNEINLRNNFSFKTPFIYVLYENL